MQSLTKRYDVAWNQTATEFAEEISVKVDELKKLGLNYTNSEIGDKIYENLLPGPRLFIFTNLMSQRIPCDLQSISENLEIYDDTTTSIKVSEFSTDNLNANVAESREMYKSEEENEDSLYNKSSIKSQEHNIPEIFWEVKEI